MKVSPGERVAWARVLTPRGWLVASLRVPGRQPLLRFLNGPQRYLHLAEVASGWRRPGSAPLSLRKDQILAVVPDVDERVAPVPERGRGVRFLTTLLLARGDVTGRFDLGRGRTPESFLERAQRFVVLERCRVRVPGANLSRSGTVRVAIVNTGAIVGVSSRKDEVG